MIDFLSSLLNQNYVIMLNGRRVVGPSDIDKLIMEEGITREEAIKKNNGGGAP